MTKQARERLTHTASWNVRDIDGLECFRAHNMIHRFSRHSHEGYTIGVIENGLGDNNYKGSVFHLSPGKIVVMNPDEVHTGAVASETPWSYRMFYINRETLMDMLPDKSVSPFFRGLCFNHDHWFRELRYLHQLLENSDDKLEQQTAFMETMSRFAMAFGKAGQALDQGNEPKAVMRIKEFLNAHYTQNISIDDLARITQLSRAYLMRSFRHCVGMPPYAYLIQLRIKKAKQLLARKLPAAQVAYETGFCDQSHMARHFKSLTGITPRQYAMGHC